VGAAVSEHRHNPGPWTVEEYGDDETPSLVIHKDTESRICFLATPGSHGDPAIIEANAHLIAAAPDLLAACERAEWWLSTVPDSAEIREVLRAAIAKATNG